MVELKRPNPVVTSSGNDGAKLAPGIETQILLAPELFKAEGGIARISRLYLQAMADNQPGRPPVVIVLNDDQIPQESLARYHAAGSHAIGCGGSKLRCFQAVWNVTKAPGTHVVSTHVHLAPLLWLIRIFGRNLTYDVVVHGIEVWPPLSWLTLRALSGARLVFSVSDYTRQSILKRHPNLTNNIVVLPNALDPSFETAASTSPPAESTILTVSRLAAHDHEKGIDHLIAAMPQVIEQIPSAQLRIVGEGVDRTRLEQLAYASPARAHITFLGFVQETELSREFHTCTLFALPSRKEGFGLVYLEAMAAGKPCIAANEGGAPEVVDLHSGLIVLYGEISPLAKALIRALEQKWSQENIQARARSFSFPVFASRWKSFGSITV